MVDLFIGGQNHTFNRQNASTHLFWGISPQKHLQPEFSHNPRPMHTYQSDSKSVKRPSKKVSPASCQGRLTLAQTEANFRCVSIKNKLLAKRIYTILPQEAMSACWRASKPSSKHPKCMRTDRLHRVSFWQWPE